MRWFHPRYERTTQTGFHVERTPLATLSLNVNRHCNVFHGVAFPKASASAISCNISLCLNPVLDVAGIVTVGGSTEISIETVCHGHGIGWPHINFAQSLSGCLHVLTVFILSLAFLGLFQRAPFWRCARNGPLCYFFVVTENSI